MITPTQREEWKEYLAIATSLCDDFIYVMNIFHGTAKGSHLDAMEIFYVQKETKEGDPFNDKHIVGPSPVFDVITQYITQP